MSIYSGLPTRQAQTNYNKLVSRLISTLQDHIISISNGIISAHFSSKYTRIIAKMEEYQQHKYLPPKFSNILKPLQQAMKNTLVENASNSNVKSKGGQFGVIKLQAVREEQQLNSSRQMNKYKTELYMKKSIIKNKRMAQREQRELFTEPSEKQKQKQKQKYIQREKQKRSRSVFSDKKSLFELDIKNTEKFKARETMAEMNYKRSQISSSSASRQKMTNNKVVLAPALTENENSKKQRGKNLLQALSEAAKTNNQN